MVGEWTRIKNAGHEASWRSVVCWWSAAVDDIQGQECWEGYRKVKEHQFAEYQSVWRMAEVVYFYFYNYF